VIVGCPEALWTPRLVRWIPADGRDRADCRHSACAQPHHQLLVDNADIETSGVFISR
jgi:hypothetical protein